MVESVIVNDEGKPAIVLSSTEAQALDDIAKLYRIKDEHKNALGWAIIHMRDLVRLPMNEDDQGTADYFMTHMPEMLEEFIQRTF